MTQKNKLHPKLIIFDLDGTLADTVGSITEAMNAALAEMGLPARDEAHIRRSVGNGARLLCIRVLPEDKRDDATVSRLLKIYNRTYGETYMHVHEPRVSSTADPSSPIPPRRLRYARASAFRRPTPLW